MLKHLELLGTPVGPEFLHCTPCQPTHAGGTDLDTGNIVLCQGRFMSKKHMEDTITHELLHLYDQSRFSVDWSNLRHHACSEVRLLFRVSSFDVGIDLLTGSCVQLEWRLSLGPGSSTIILLVLKAAPGELNSQMFMMIAMSNSISQACVRRRAVASVQANPSCPDRAAAERAVNEVFDSCFKDTRPFDEVTRFSKPHHTTTHKVFRFINCYLLSTCRTLCWFMSHDGTLSVFISGSFGAKYGEFYSYSQ